MATVEYAALVLLVAAAISAGAALVGPDRIADGVAAQIRRAHCLVAGGDCLARGGPQPCVVHARSRERETEGALALLRLRDGRTVLRELRSDGTVRVTVVESNGAGVVVGLGGRLSLGGRGVGTVAEGGAGMDGGYGRVFVAADVAAADRLIERLADERPVTGGGATGLVRFATGGGGRGEDQWFAEVSSGVHAEAVLRAVGLEAQATALRDTTASVRVDRRTGERTLGLRLDDEVAGELGASLDGLGAGELGASLDGLGDGELAASLDGLGAGARTAVELTTGADGRPLTLTLHRTGSVRGDGRGHLVEAQARLDLTSPRARELAGRVVRADPGAARELAELIASTARIDVRRYATTRAEEAKSWSLPLGGRIGAEVATVTATARLVAADGWEPGLGWSRRLDCVLAA